MKTIKLLPFLLLISISLFAQQNPIQIDANGLTQTLAAGGLVNRGQIVKINGAGQVVPVATTDTSGAIGIAATSQQNQGQSITVSIAGTPLVQIDSGGCAAGNFVAISTITAGAGHCSTTTGVGQIGVALSISSPGSNFWNVSLSLGGGGSSPVVSLPGPVFNVKDPKYGAVGDAKSTRDCTVTNGSAVWTSASNPWLSTDVGKFAYSSQGYGNPPFAVTKITGFTNPGSITVQTAAAGPGTGTCVWFTQKDTAAFTGALAAAKSALASQDPHITSPTLGYASQVYCPPGGYVLDGSWFTQNNATANTNGVSFQGAGRGSCQIYISPDFVAGTGAVFGYNQQAVNFFMDGFSISGSGMAFNFPGLPALRFENLANLRLTNFSIADYSNTGDTGTPGGIIYTGSGSGLTLENLLLVTGGAGALYQCNGTGAVLGLNNTLSNSSNINLNINCGSRGGNAQPFVWKGALVDECGAGSAAACTIVQAGAVVDFDSVGLYGESSNFGALNCLGTCYLNSVDVGSFNSANNQPAIVEGSTGYVYATGSWIRGNGTSPMVTGTAAATFIDAGGNKWLNGTATTFNPVTAAQYATLGFTGGIVPKAAVTHTPNTCFAVTGNLLATAQNICTLLLDQNYQLVNIAAQSGGTTPASSSCATPPVITLSDGTRSETMTMTSGQTVWCSTTSGSCTASAVTNPNQVFAIGALLTVSIGANTCATPPSNVSVNYVLQSVLNP